VRGREKEQSEVKREGDKEREGNFAFLISSANCTVMTLCYYQKFILANSQLPQQTHARVTAMA
jgi:hypothetical protein